MESRAGGCSASCTTEAPHRSRLQRAQVHYWRRVHSWKSDGIVVRGRD